MRRLNCVRCGNEMFFFKREKLQLGQTGFFLGDWPNLIAGALQVEIYGCNQCGKLEFMMPGFPKKEYDEPEMELEDLPPAEDQNIVGVSMDGVPQVCCPVCGKKHDFDYPRCPYCEHAY